MSLDDRPVLVDSILFLFFFVRLGFAYALFFAFNASLLPFYFQTSVRKEKALFPIVSPVAVILFFTLGELYTFH